MRTDADLVPHYLAIIHGTNFHYIRIVKSKRIDLPSEVLAGILTEGELAARRDADPNVRSVTVVGIKPMDRNGFRPA